MAPDMIGVQGLEGAQQRERSLVKRGSVTRAVGVDPIESFFGIDGSNKGSDSGSTIFNRRDHMDGWTAVPWHIADA